MRVIKDPIKTGPRNFYLDPASSLFCSLTISGSNIIEEFREQQRATLGQPVLKTAPVKRRSYTGPVTKLC